jgi:hypothetical protein
LKYLGIEGGIILECILSQVGGKGLDWSGSEYGQVAGYCENITESLGSIKCKEFLDQLRNY